SSKFNNATSPVSVQAGLVNVLILLLKDTYQNFGSAEHISQLIYPKNVSSIPVTIDLMLGTVPNSRWKKYIQTIKTDNVPYHSESKRKDVPLQTNPTPRF
ncbi:hypothetical protein CEXT_239821, partial [Caerostris extrusa]